MFILILFSASLFVKICLKVFRKYMFIFFNFFIGKVMFDVRFVDLGLDVDNFFFIII